METTIPDNQSFWLINDSLWSSIKYSIERECHGLLLKAGVINIVKMNGTFYTIIYLKI